MVSRSFGKPKAKGPLMDVPSLVMSVSLLVVILGIVYWRRGGVGVGEGFTKSGGLLFQGAPNLIVGFLVAGFISALLPATLAGTWMGEGSGAKGLWMGTLAGMVTPGGPMAQFPILASLAQKGAGIGPMTAYFAAWSLLGLHRAFVWEAPFLGWRFVVARMTACFLFPPIMGWIARGVALALGSSHRIRLDP
jgi:uncharacterized membrane protein YraQ (UPF0718 family)